MANLLPSQRNSLCRYLWQNNLSTIGSIGYDTLANIYTTLRCNPKYYLSPTGNTSKSTFTVEEFIHSENKLRTQLMVSIS